MFECTGPVTAARPRVLSPGSRGWAGPLRLLARQLADRNLWQQREGQRAPGCPAQASDRRHPLNAQNPFPSGSAITVRPRVPCRGTAMVATSAFRPARSRGVDVQVHPVLDGLGIRDRVDPGRVLRRAPSSSPSPSSWACQVRPSTAAQNAPGRAGSPASRHKFLNARSPRQEATLIRDFAWRERPAGRYPRAAPRCLAAAKRADCCRVPGWANYQTARQRRARSCGFRL